MSNSVKLQQLNWEPKEYSFSYGGVTISVNKEGEVTIRGAKSLNVESDDFSVESKRVSIRATESYDLNVDGKVYIGASEPITIQSQKIDLNPYLGIDSEGKEYAKSGYKEKK